MGRPQPGCAPGKHGPAAKLMSAPLMRFRRASTGQQIYDGSARSVILVNWSCGREMLTKSSQRKRLYRPERFRRGSIRRVAQLTRESHRRVMGYRRRIRVDRAFYLQVLISWFINTRRLFCIVLFDSILELLVFLPSFREEKTNFQKSRM